MDQAPSRASGPPGRTVDLRSIGPGDRDLLLTWANDPATRAASFHPAPIDAATHDAWFARRLADGTGRTWVGEVDGHPIGQVRIDLDESGRGEVGISIAPDARGRRLARPLLAAGIAAAVAELGVTGFVALVRPDNAASIRLFRGAGFRDTGAGERDGTGCRVLLLEVGADGR